MIISLLQYLLENVLKYNVEYVTNNVSTVRPKETDNFNQMITDTFVG
jgi:hypothetical protein